MARYGFMGLLLLGVFFDLIELPNITRHFGMFGEVGSFTYIVLVIIAINVFSWRALEKFVHSPEVTHCPLL